MRCFTHVSVAVARARTLGLAILLASPAAALAVAPPVDLKWLDGTPPATPIGVSWGVSWPKGEVPKTQTFALTSADGKPLPVQTWPLAYWPDGSIKWTGIATVAGPDAASVRIAPGTPAALESTLKVTEDGQSILIDTGKLVARIPKRGQNLIDSLAVDGREVATNGKLQCIVQNGAEMDYLKLPARDQYISDVKKVTVEQQGPVRAVVKFEGVHKAVSGSREWLPFIVRLYFYTKNEPVRMVHTIIYDGDQDKDLVRGLGIVFDVPLRESVAGRTVRFANSNGGLWSETSVTLGGGFGGGGGRGAGAATQPFGGFPGGVGPGTQPATQQAGRGAGRGAGRAGGGFARGGPATLPGAPGQANGPATQPGGFPGGRGGAGGGFGRGGGGAGEGPAQWSDFKLTQLSSEGFRIVKRTNKESTWISSAEGERAAGLVFAGDSTGGLGVAVRNFWQSYPAALEVEGLITPTAKLVVWLWSPDGPAMDMRWYDTKGHGNVNGSGSYEDYEAGYDDPVGVARTSELTLFPTGSLPSREETVAQSKVNSQPPLLTTSPQYLHSTNVFGVWAVQDRSTPFKQQVEDRLDAGVNYYIKQRDQHHWYGYWNFGDVMHAYDGGRHSWRYDVGGYAWDNSELGSVLWAWYSYIRTGNPEFFRFAEAMSRHCSEVDTYHLGRFAGMGSRHNVVHWGDSAKEARVSQAAHNRFHYYLTTDERIGDVLREAATVDALGSAIDPMRKARPRTEAEAKYPGRIRMGPDWLAFAGNWMTEWERTGDTKWRDKIMAGVNSMADMTFWMRSGPDLVVGYDPATSKLFQVSNVPGDYNLPTIQGGGEVAFELTDLLNEPTWTKIWLQYCRLGKASAELLLKDKETGTEGADASLVGERGGNSQGTARLAAYVYHKTKIPAFGQRAVSLMNYGNPDYTTRRIDGAEVLNPLDEAGGVSTNTTAQSSLMDIEILEMCKDILPTERLAPVGRGGGGGRGGRGGAGFGPRGGGAAPAAEGAGAAPAPAPAGN